MARENLVQGMLQEFSLSSDEGVALMCLAEALLRIPDSATRDALIRDKIGRGDWRAHLGGSESPFINAATWGLLVTGKLVATHDERGLSNALTRATARVGEPVIRKAVDLGMRLMGKQFVAGETIADALENAVRFEAQGFRYSYDMLGEAAMTSADATRYLASYESAIHAIGLAAAGRGVEGGPGISIKLSALHPRYTFAQRERVFAELYPRVKSLVLLAKGFDIGINIDAEEADRLDLSLDLLEMLCAEPGLAGWNGIGFVIQAYGKRCPFVVDFLVDLARRTRRRLMVRLVKGAYWDSEIKRAQVDGLDGYPVYTRKVYTDVSYLACARMLLAAPAEIFPQFATHNAQTLASIYEMAGDYRPGQCEFQCLHGMGEPLYQQVVGADQGKLGRPCRIYAPVGTHETLLAYLVRRLLENGANTSFINRIADAAVSLDELVASPVDVVRRMQAEDGVLGLPHPKIPLPRALFGALRANSRGLELTDESALASLARELVATAAEPWRAGPTSASRGEARAGAKVLNPADPSDVVGEVVDADLDDVEAALRTAQNAILRWGSTAAGERAACLERAAVMLEAEMPRLMGLIVREAGKTYSNAIAEVREAVDFLRYYAGQARRLPAEGPHALGPVVCISPWNFPLAIFTGQVSAALAAGNPVLAKPAEQTPLIAAQAVRILHAAGVPEDALQLLPGAGEIVGARLVEDPRVRGVVFTGSTDVARTIQRTLAGRLDPDGRPVPLIAETGGQNAMIVDSSALAEQVVADAIVSAFDSAGQRCSALRVLCVQEEVADRVLEMLRGAMSELELGDPQRLAVDVGPVIDEPARRMLADYVEKMRAQGFRVHQVQAHTDPKETARRGTFLPPTLIEIDRIEDLEREVFGPVLHVLRWRRERLDALIDGINGLEYGLTLGVHSRVDETIDRIVERARVGNVYVNRNIVGAVVGVQPFGGEGLSGTGPKAGGPMYLQRLLSGGFPDSAIRELRALDEPGVRASLKNYHPSLAPFEAFRAWAAKSAPELAATCDRLAAFSPAGATIVLPGPTGERNSYTVLPRRAVLCVADDDRELMSQVAIVLSVGSRAVIASSDRAKRVLRMLPAEVTRAVSTIASDWKPADTSFDAVLHQGSLDERRALLLRVAGRDGPLVSLHALLPGDESMPLERLLIERVVSVNTAAAGGNASLMTVG